MAITALLHHVRRLCDRRDAAYALDPDRNPAFRAHLAGREARLAEVAELEAEADRSADARFLESLDPASNARRAAAHRMLVKGYGGLFAPRLGAHYTTTAAFRAWFGRSQILDAWGRPLVLYYACRGPDRPEITVPGSGRYLMTRPQIVLKAMVDWAGWDFVRDEGQRLVPLFVRVERPYFSVVGDNPWRWTRGTDWVRAKQVWQMEQVRAHGYDGFVLQKPWGGQDAPFWIVVVFAPEQVKSALGNRGTFDPQSRALVE